MKVLVTGGAGRVGRQVVRELLERGHEVTVVGRTPDREVEPGATYRVLDATDAEATVRGLEGFERVVHLAAEPSPGRIPDTELFRINVTGTYNLFEACAVHGIPRVAVASSINYLGQRFGQRRIPVHYFPLDEEHPNLATDSYSFSKELTERCAYYAYEKYAIHSVSLRIPAVVGPSERRLNHLRQAAAEGATGGMAPDFFVIVDTRDSARAFAAGIEVEYQGAHPLFINDRVNCYGLSTEELLARHYPDVTERRAPLPGTTAPISCARAKALLGWEPAYSWAGALAGEPLP